MATLATINIKAALDAKGIEKGVSQGKSSLLGFANWAKGAFAAAMSTAAVGAFVGWGAKLAADAEQSKVAFEVMLGSADKAVAMLKRIKSFAASTPFGEMDLQDAAKTMLAFGVAAEDIMPSLKMLGDISGGNAEKLKSLALVFGQVSAAGRATLGDINQFINAGFNPLQEMAKKTGKSMGQLRDEVSKGLITFDMIAESLSSATSEGGQFFGMMEKQSQTIAGRFSTLQDLVADFARQFGEAFAPLTSILLDVASTFMELIIPAARAFLDTIVAMLMPTEGMPDIWEQVGYWIEMAGELATNFFSVVIGSWSVAKAVQGTYFTLLQLGIANAQLAWDQFWGNSTDSVEKEIKRLYDFLEYYQDVGARGVEQVQRGFSGEAGKDFRKNLEKLKNDANTGADGLGENLKLAATAAANTIKVAFKDINPAALERGSSGTVSAILRAQREAEGNRTEKAMLEQLKAIARNTGGAGPLPANI